MEVTWRHCRQELHFATITYHIQCKSILSTLIAHPSPFEKKVSGLERDKNPLDVPFGLINYCNEFLETPAIVAEKYIPDSSFNIKTFLYKLPKLEYFDADPTG